MLETEAAKKLAENDTSIALIQRLHSRKVNIKQQRSDPRHAPPHLGPPIAATMQPVAFAAFEKEHKKDAQGENGESIDNFQRQHSRETQF